MPRPLSVTVTKPSAVELDLDEVGVAGQRLVHGVVDHLGEQVMQRLLVGAADIHAGPAAHRLEPLQHLDVLAPCSRLRRRSGLAPAPALSPGVLPDERCDFSHAGEQVADGCGFLRIFRGLVDGLGHACDAVDGAIGKADESVMRQICHGKRARGAFLDASRYWPIRGGRDKKCWQSPRAEFPRRRESPQEVQWTSTAISSRSSTMFGCIRPGRRRSCSRCALPSRSPSFRC